MGTIDIDDPQTHLETLLQSGSPGSIEAFFEEKPPSEAVRVLLRLSVDEQRGVLRALSPDLAARILEQVPEPQAADLLEIIRPDEAAAIVEKLPSDEQADILRDVNKPEAEAILDEMTPADAQEARTLVKYADDVAGGLMITEYLSYPERFTAGQVVYDIRANVQKYRDYNVQYAYVTGAGGELLGVLSLRDLLLAGEHAPVTSVMAKAAAVVRDDASLEQIRDSFAEHRFLAVPVLDSAHRLLGVVQAAAVEEALGERGESDYLKSFGIIGGDELRTMPLTLRFGRRFSWLSLNIGLNFLAVSVIAVYQDTLAAAIALAVFLPIVSDMGGNSGYQAAAVSIRELTLGLLKPQEILRVVAHESALGALNGLGLGILIAGAAWLWKGSLYLALVVGVALALNTIVAGAIGGLIPLVLKRLRMDPALASGPILTTITDMSGFFLVLSLASAVTPRLLS